MRRALPPLFAALLLGSCSTGGDGNGGDPADGGGGGGDGGGADAGAADAGLPPCETDQTMPCTGTTAGTCTVGERTCADGVWGPCLGRKQPAPGACRFETCAQAGALNPGCACTPGEVQSCYGGAEGTAGRGLCALGFQRCVAIAGGSKWGDCEREVRPTAVDDCSGRDSNCNNTFNEDCTCTGTATRACAGVSTGTCKPGTQACTGGQWGDCTDAVQPDKGNCAVPSCAGGPNPGCPCYDGQTEGCYTGVFGTDSLGTCRAGTRTCAGGVWSACAGEVFPIPNLCAATGCTGGPNPGCE